VVAVNSGPVIVTFISGKGGSGKTVTCSAIGRFLAHLGFSVLMVDTDASTNGLTMLFLSEVNKMKREASYAAGIFDGEEILTPVPIVENLQFVPATFTLSQTDATEMDSFKRSVASAIRWAEVMSVDYVLLDAQAGSDEYAKVAASFGHNVVIVSEFDPISAQGVDRLKILFSGVMRPDNTWILYNKVLPEFASAIREALVITRVLPPLAWSADVIRSFAQRTLAVDFENPNPYTLNISQVVENLFGPEMRVRIRQWSDSVQEAIQEPLLRDLQEVEREIDALRYVEIESNLKLKDASRRDALRLAAATLILAGGGGTGVYAFYKTLPVPDALSTGALAFTAAIAAPILALVVTFIAFSQRQSRYKREIQLRSEMTVIERRLQDLNETRQRLKVMAGDAEADSSTTRIARQIVARSEEARSHAKPKA
jgi:MinD-like ATPase involved in chromosome partitioning or flagellar assembly